MVAEGNLRKVVLHLLSHVCLVSAPETSMSTNDTASAAEVVVASTVERGKKGAGGKVIKRAFLKYKLMFFIS